MSDDLDLPWRIALDLGADADVELPGDPDFDAWIAKQASSVNAPPLAPRAEMWAAIEGAQLGSRTGVRPLRRERWVWPAAVAAALLLGVALDRLALRASNDGGMQPAPDRVAEAPAPVAPDSSRGDSSVRAEPGASTAATPTRVATRAPAAPTRVATGAPATPPASAERATVVRPFPSDDPADRSPAAGSRDANRLYRLAAVQTLSQAEALLTAYRASDLAGRNVPATQQLGRWGRDVLSSTRLLMDSPAGADPQLRPLLNDLELVLVQIVRLSGAPLDAADRALIDRSLRDSDLLPRIRTAVPAGVAGAASDE